jgi:RNA polymerase sigma factor (sigma-70 family)
VPGEQAVVQPEAERLFAEHRGLLYAVAYRVLGSVTEAEDVVQDAWLRWSRVDVGTVAHAEGFVVRVATRLAIDSLRSVRMRREAYVGPWLPEPMLTSQDAAEDVLLAESVSTAMLLVLETLSPVERAVFVLGEVFGYSNAEIAGCVGRNDVAMRQIAQALGCHELVAAANSVAAAVGGRFPEPLRRVERAVVPTLAGVRLGHDGLRRIRRAQLFDGEGEAGDPMVARVIPGPHLIALVALEGGHLPVRMPRRAGFGERDLGVVPVRRVTRSL